MSEQYLGWKNRETWKAYTIIANDYLLFHWSIGKSPEELRQKLNKEGDIDWPSIAEQLNLTALVSEVSEAMDKLGDDFFEGGDK